MTGQARKSLKIGLRAPILSEPVDLADLVRRSQIIEKAVFSVLEMWRGWQSICLGTRSLKAKLGYGVAPAFTRPHYEPA